MTADIDAGFQGRVGNLPQHRTPLAERIELLGLLSGRDVRACDSNPEKTAAMLRMYVSNQNVSPRVQFVEDRCEAVRKGRR
jgi:hypothetical protein